MPDGSSKTFFSYAREDSEFVLRLVKDLRAAGAAVWLDRLDIGAGKHWDTEVEKALHECPRHVTVLSPASVDSQNVKDEVNFALEEGKQMIPLLYRDCSIPFRLRRVQYIDFRGDYAAGVQDVLKALGVVQPVVSQTPEPRVEAPAGLTIGGVSLGTAAQPAPAPNFNLEQLQAGAEKTVTPESPVAREEMSDLVREEPKLEQADIVVIPAFDALIQGMRLKLDLADVCNYRATTYYYNDQYDMAIEDYNQGLKIIPDDEDFYYNRANAHCCKGQYDEGIQDYDEALNINANYRYAYNNRGLAYAHKGDQSLPFEQGQYYSLALQDFDRALQLDPNDEIAQTNRKELADRLSTFRDRR
jgi:tetratricopeptide (TPR) repeat protein